MDIGLRGGQHAYRPYAASLPVCAPTVEVFVPRFLRLDRAAGAPRLPLCGSLRLPPSVPAGSFHPARISPCWAHWRAHSCVPCRHSWRHVLGSQACHQPDPTVAPRPRPSKKANKRSTNFPKSAQTCSPRRKKQQSRRRQPAVKTPNHLPSIKSKTSPSPAATTRNLIKTRRSQPNDFRKLQ